MRARDNLQIERMRRFASLAKSLAQTDDQLALITMLLDDYYQQSLHAPPAPPAEEAGLTTAKKRQEKEGFVTKREVKEGIKSWKTKSCI